MTITSVRLDLPSRAQTGKEGFSLPDIELEPNNEGAVKTPKSCADLRKNLYLTILLEARRIGEQGRNPPAGNLSTSDYDQFKDHMDVYQGRCRASPDAEKELKKHQVIQQVGQSMNRGLSPEQAIGKLVKPQKKTSKMQEAVQEAPSAENASSQNSGNGALKAAASIPLAILGAGLWLIKSILPKPGFAH
jgi:hypothetical protein